MHLWEGCACEAVRGPCLASQICWTNPAINQETDAGVKSPSHSETDFISWWEVVQVIVPFKKTNPHKTYLFNNLNFPCFYNKLEGNGIPLQHSCLENPMDGGAWWAAVHGVAKSWTRLSDFPFTFHFHALEKEMATHSSVLAWRIPGMGEPHGLPSVGSHRVGHNWSDLAAVAVAEGKLTTNHHLCLNQDSKIWLVGNRVNHIFNIKNITFSICFG